MRTRRVVRNTVANGRQRGSSRDAAVQAGLTGGHPEMRMRRRRGLRCAVSWRVLAYGYRAGAEGRPGYACRLRRGPCARGFVLRLRAPPGRAARPFLPLLLSSLSPATRNGVPLDNSGRSPPVAHTVDAAAGPSVPTHPRPKRLKKRDTGLVCVRRTAHGTYPCFSLVWSSLMMCAGFPVVHPRCSATPRYRYPPVDIAVMLQTR